MMSTRPRSSMREMSHSRRTESVMRPTLPLTGSAIAWPIWMTSLAGGSSPQGAVMIRTSCPSSVRWLYDSRMYEFAPPGRGYAYGLTMPIFIGLVPRVSSPPASRRRLDASPAGSLVDSLVGAKPLLVRSLLLRSHSSPRPLERISHHRAPLLARDAIEMLPEGPVSPVRRRRARFDRRPQVRGAPARIVRPRRPHEPGAMRVARAGGRNTQHTRVEPFRAVPSDAPGVRGVA